MANLFSRLSIATDTPSRETVPKAKAALKALEVDDRLTEAYVSLGWINFYHEWDWEMSEKNYRRALELNPADFSARLGYAHLLSNTGRHDEALREVNEAVRLDPLSPLANALKGQFLSAAGRHQEAIDQLKGTLKTDPAFWVALVQLGKIYVREGRYDEALEAFRRARETGGTTSSLSLTGTALAAAGRRQEAKRMLLELRALAAKSYVPPYNLAAIHNGLGETDEALRRLERAYHEKDPRMVFLGVDKQWDNLRDIPPFVSLLQRMNLLR